MAEHRRQPLPAFIRLNQPKNYVGHPKGHRYFKYRTSLEIGRFEHAPEPYPAVMSFKFQYLKFMNGCILTTTTALQQISSKDMSFEKLLVVGRVLPCYEHGPLSFLRKTLQLSIPHSSPWRYHIHNCEI